LTPNLFLAAKPKVSGYIRPIRKNPAHEHEARQKRTQAPSGNEKKRIMISQNIRQ
jgi:hypothetical protein